MGKIKLHDFFVYRSNPFRPLYLGARFYEPRQGRDAGKHLWLFRSRDVARLMAAGNKCEYADFRDYARIASGGKPYQPPEPAGRRGANHRPPTLEELA